MEWHSQYLWSKTGVAPCQPEGQSAPLERADQPPGLIVLLPEDPMNILASFLNDNIRAENVSCSTKQPSALEGCKRPALHPAYFLLSHLQSISHAVSLQPKAYPLCIISKVPIGAGMGRTDLFAGDLTFQSGRKEKRKGYSRHSPLDTDISSEVLSQARLTCYDLYRQAGRSPLIFLLALFSSDMSGSREGDLSYFGSWPLWREGEASVSIREILLCVLLSLEDIVSTVRFFGHSAGSITIPTKDRAFGRFFMGRGV